jgi:integrase/recombinase XerD
MAAQNLAQGTILNSNTMLDTDLLSWIGAFLLDRKVQNVAPGTLKFYQKKCQLFIGFCEGQLIKNVTDITPNIIRSYLLFLEEKGHNPGGIHAAYRALKAFLRWFENEAEPEGWSDPINKVKAPRVGLAPLEPADLGDIQSLLKTCDPNNFLGARDRALILFLLDSGVRAGELLDINLVDIDLITGAVVIKHGKGRKPRTVYVGKMSRKALRSYLKCCKGDNPALWISSQGERLTYDGLRAIITRRAKLADVKSPSLHSFRRAFAINMLRAGVDVFSLQKLMGHADLQVLRRYLAQTTEDIAQAHRIGSPVDNNRSRY